MSKLRTNQCISNMRIFTISLLFILGCGANIAPNAGVARNVTGLSQDSAAIRAKRLLHRELSSRTAADYPPPDSNTLAFVVDTSRVVDGLVYYWGEYRPAGTADVVFRSLVAALNGHVALVRTPEDWVAFVGRDNSTTWPKALERCAEVLYVTAQRRTPDLRPVVFLEPGTFQGFPYAVPDKAIANRLESPVIVNEMGQVQIVFWAIERRDIQKYQCTLSDSGMRLQMLDSLPGYGFIS